MSDWAWYNENDPFAAQWLDLLIIDGHIAPGYVDRRSIVEVRGDDLRGFKQCHFFAGIGGWSYALRLAGVPDNEPIWTGSCPCQPFSAAGKRKGTADARHLWPEMHRLVAECGPATVFGEQVASKDGRLWLSGVRTDLEALGYGVGAADLCAAGIGAPHIRQRLYWMADACGPRTGWNSGTRTRSETGLCSTGDTDGLQCSDPPKSRRTDGRLADAEHAERRAEREIYGNAHWRDGLGGCCDVGGMGNTDDARSQGRCEHVGEHADQRTAWASSLLIPCADGKFRRVPANEASEPEPSLFPLAYGVRNRVGTLRGAGNAIVPQVAAAFVAAALG